MTITTKIKYNKDYEEYQVNLYIDNELQGKATYFTDDKEDAKQTAKRMIEDCKQTETEETILYDVCNDYSLDVAEDQDKDLSLYRSKETTINGNTVRIYTHFEYDEIHYLIGPGGLNKLFLDITNNKGA